MTTTITINKSVHFLETDFCFYFSYSPSIMSLCLYVCVRTEQHSCSCLLVGKRERKKRERKEEPSRKKGRQARSSRSNAIMDRVNTKGEKKEPRIFYVHIIRTSNSYHSCSVRSPLSVMHVRVNSCNYRTIKLEKYTGETLNI